MKGERLDRVLSKIEDQIELCDPNDKTGGYIVLQREDAEFLRDEIERLEATRADIITLIERLNEELRDYNMLPRP